MFRNIIILFSIFVLFACESGQPNTYDSFTGSWKCDEIGSVSGFKSYMVMVDKSSTNGSHLIIRNFFDAGDNHMIVVAKTDSILSLSEQPTSGHIISNFKGNCKEFTSITYTYTMFDGEKELKFDVVLSRN